ncbi:MAG: PEP-utilizing enzyme [Nanoarchaeota archaeon]
MDMQLGRKIEKMDESFFRNMINVANKIYAKGVKSGESLKNAEPTIENFKKFLKTAKEINLLWLLAASYFVETTEEKLRETVINENFPAERVMEILPQVVTPTYYRYQELFKIKKEIGNKSFAEIKKDKKLNKKFEEHVRKYLWVEIFNFAGRPLTLDILYEQVKHMQDVIHDSALKPANLLSKELKFRAKCMSDCGYIKQAGAEYFSIFSEKVLYFLNKVAKKIGISYDEFLCLSTKEVEMALVNELHSKELKARAKKRKNMNDWILYSVEDGEVVFCDEPSDITILKDILIPKADKNLKEIKGDIGNIGKYTGHVRIVMNAEEFHKMKAGDVLVSTMTTPDFVVLMQKSGAIITDLGGILSHASIVSREINKPCVIGTRFATQILKDGDLVEVDADKGIVRIIERKK